MPPWAWEGPTFPTTPLGNRKKAKLVFSIDVSPSCVGHVQHAKFSEGSVEQRFLHLFRGSPGNPVDGKLKMSLFFCVFLKHFIRILRKSGNEEKATDNKII